MNKNLLNLKKTKSILLFALAVIAVYFIYRFFAYDYDISANQVFRINKITGSVCRRSAFLKTDNWICPKDTQ